MYRHHTVTRHLYLLCCITDTCAIHLPTSELSSNFSVYANTSSPTHHRSHSVTHTLSHTVWTELVLVWKWIHRLQLAQWHGSGARSLSSLPSPPLPPAVNYYLAVAAPPLVYRGTYWYGTAFDHHARSRSSASIAFADPASAGSHG